MPASKTRSPKQPKPSAKPRPVRSIDRSADSKGRVLLGQAFANKRVIIEQTSDTELVVKLARVIPESEVWLYDSPAALDSVRKGLAQARAGDFVEGPDLNADARLLRELEG